MGYMREKGVSHPKTSRAASDAHSSQGLKSTGGRFPATLNVPIHILSSGQAESVAVKAASPGLTEASLDVLGQNKLRLP